MKYVNANDILPEELLSMIQTYYQGGYLYIPQKDHRSVKQPTAYKIELEKRNQHIYLKHLEGRTNGQLEDIYHLSQASIRRIIAKEKVKYQKMKETIEQILPLWGMNHKQLQQIYPSAWEVDHSYVLKIYHDKKQLNRNIKISEVLSDCNIPVAKTVLTKNREKFVSYQSTYFLMSHKLPGNNISDQKDKTAAWKMGHAIAQLHTAFQKCEREIEFWDNSLLKEMKEWVRESLANNEWQIVSKEEYTKTVTLLESVYDDLPKQLIHRDVHFGNFLFYEGSFSGYIDFDLSQRNIRIFDICYFVTGLLAEETDDALTKTEWMEIMKSAIAGYESILPLTEQEKTAIPCVMSCIEILCGAYFININDTKHAHDASQVFRFIQSCGSDIRGNI